MRAEWMTPPCRGLEPKQEALKFHGDQGDHSIQITCNSVAPSVHSLNQAAGA